MVRAPETHAKMGHIIEKKFMDKENEFLHSNQKFNSEFLSDCEDHRGDNNRHSQASLLTSGSVTEGNNQSRRKPGRPKKALSATSSSGSESEAINESRRKPSRESRPKKASS